VPSIGTQVVPLAVALGLSLLIGIEREVRHKVAGLRTHALVGMGSALFMLVSKYGFNDILEPGRVVSNPGQMAGQVITGIGFLGAGIIFVRRDSARGIITAASIWVVAAIGMTAGAGLYGLAVAATIGDLLILGCTHTRHRTAQAHRGDRRRPEVDLPAGNRSTAPGHDRADRGRLHG
jgi:putative Mg2+ transporter-C (MgtC) family protein